MDSPRAIPTRTEYIPQPVVSQPSNLLSHCLLAFEVTRLMSVVKEYEASLQKLSGELDKLVPENYHLKKENRDLISRIGDLERKLSQQQSPVRQVVQVQQAPSTPPRQVQPQPQIVQVIRQAEPVVVRQPEKRTDQITLNIADYLNDDKNSLIQLLVKRNIENDQLRKEIDYLRNGNGVPRSDYIIAEPERKDKKISKDLLMKLVTVFASLQEKKPEHKSDLEIVKLKLEGLSNKVDRVDSSQESTPFRTDKLMVPPGMLDDSMRDIHKGNTAFGSGRTEYEREKDQVFSLILDTINKLVDHKSVSLNPFDPYPSREPVNQSDLLSRFAVPPLANYPDLREDLVRAQRRINDLENVLARGPQSDAQEISRLTRLVEEYKEKLDGREREKENWTLKYRSEIEDVGKRKDLEEKEMRDSLKKANERVVDLERKVNGKDETIDSLRNEIAEKSIRLGETEGRVRGYQVEIAGLKERLEMSEEDRKAKQKEARELAESLNEKDNRIKATQENERHLSNEMEELDNTLSFLKTKAEELGKNLDASERSVRNLQNKLSLAQDRINSLEAQNSELRTQITEKNHLMEKTGEKLFKMRTLIGEVKREHSKIKSTIKEDSQVLRKNTDSIKDLLQNEAEVNPNGTLKMLMDLRENNSSELGRLYSKLNQVQNLVDLKKEEMNRLENEMEEKEKEHRRKIHELEKMLKESHFNNQKFERIFKEGEELTEKQKQEIDRLKHEFEVLKTEMENCQREKDKLLNSQERIKNENESKGKQIKKLEDSLEETEKEVKKLRNEIEANNNDIRRLKDELDLSRRKEEELIKELKSVHKTSSKENQAIHTPVQRKTNTSGNEGGSSTRQTASQDLSRSSLREVDIFVDPSERSVIVRHNIEKRDEERELTKELDEAHDHIKHLEKVIDEHGESQLKIRQLGDQIKILEMRLENVSTSLEIKDRELQTLKRTQANSHQTHQPQDDHDKIEILRQRTEAMLTKLERKLSELAAPRGMNLRKLERMAEEAQVLRKKLTDTNKRYVNDFINICQRSIDMYVEIQEANNG